VKLAGALRWSHFCSRREPPNFDGHSTSLPSSLLLALSFALLRPRPLKMPSQTSNVRRRRRGRGRSARLAPCRLRRNVNSGAYRNSVAHGCVAPFGMHRRRSPGPDCLGGNVFVLMGVSGMRTGPSGRGSGTGRDDGCSDETRPLTIVYLS